MPENQSQFISFPAVYKVTSYAEKSYIDDSGDYDREYTYQDKDYSFYVIVSNESELDDLYESCAEPEIRLTLICSLSHDVEELKDLSDKLLAYIEKVKK